jgi:hypothetical protein
MKNLVIFFFVFVCSMLQGQTVFKHTAITANISSNSTVIDHSATNNNPNAVLIVTSDFGSVGPYHNKAIGVWYSGGKWMIFNQNLSPMTVNAKFNVMVAAPSSSAFSHTSTETSGHITIINHPSLNNNPNAKFLVTQYWTGVYNNNPIGIYYTGTRWAIYNQNRVAMPVSAKFNIVIHSTIFVVTASVPTGNNYVFDNPATNNRPNDIVFATQYWTSVYNANEIGVWYTANKWAVFNQSLSAMPANAKFMVLSVSASSVTPSPIPVCDHITTKLLCVTSNDIHNGDCRRGYGTVDLELWEKDASGTRIRRIAASGSGTRLINWERGPVRGINNYVNGTIAPNIENIQSFFSFDPTLLTQNRLFLVVTTNLGTAHKQCDLCTDFTWEAKMTDAQVQEFSLRDVMNQPTAIKSVVCGPYVTQHPVHALRVHFSVE